MPSQRWGTASDPPRHGDVVEGAGRRRSGVPRLRRSLEGRRQPGRRTRHARTGLWSGHDLDARWGARADHFPHVAALLGDTAEAIEAAWREQL